jgi:GNAT superfamily N-acetyltransferase
VPEHTIVTLRAEDLDDVIEVWKAAGLPYRPAGRDAREAILAQMALPQCCFLGARDASGRLLGAVLVNHEGRKGWINRLAVRPEARRTGLARALLEASERWLDQEGILIVAALIEGYNEDSQALFEACAYDRDDSLVYYRKVKDPGV